MKKTIPRNVKHAFLISSYMGSVLKYHKEGRPVLLALHTRINQGMQRYALVAGSKAYHELADAGADIWRQLAETHHTLLDVNETEIFVEMLGSLMNPKNHKDFLGMEHFKTKEITTDEKYIAMCKSVLDLNDKVNTLLGTSSQVYPVLKPKVEKKKKERDKSKKIETRRKKAEKREEVRKDKVSSFLKDRIAKAKGESK